MRRVWQGLAAIAFGVLALLPEPVQASAICTPFASGGTVTVFTQGAETYCVHSFTATGNANFTALHDLDVDYMVVGGGGGGGGITSGNTGGAGGGGAGGMLEGMRALVAGAFPITVGQGGTGVSCGTTCNSDNANGGNSSFDGVIAFGGGRGAFVGNSSGAGGGSGGGGRLSSAGLGGAGTPGQGNDGGNGAGEAAAGTAGGAGGGGAGAAAASVVNDQGTAGGAGRASSITGMSVFYAGGGGGGGFGVTGGAGGSGGGGAAPAARGAGGNAIAATGGGGGGATGSVSGNAFNGGNGGSGIVVIRYLVPDLPEADAGPDQSVGSGASATLDGSASVPVGQISYSWSQTAGPFVTLTGANTVTPSFTAPTLSACQSNALLTFSLVVTDSFGRASSPDTVTITVTPPHCQGGGTGGSEVNEYNDPNGEVTWRAHSFFGNDALTLSEPTDVEYLIVGGGGGGGNSGGENHYTGGGGGAGGVLQGTFSGISGIFQINVGAGGTGGVNSVNNGLGESGQNSSFNGRIALGGGGGGGANCIPACDGRVSNPSAGGSGGGGGAQVLASTRMGAAGTAGQGHAGGRGIGSNTSEPLQSAGGGGGAGGPGGNGTNAVAGAGGVGIESSITGASQSYAGGGGGGKRTADGTAGTATDGGGSGGGGTGAPLPGNGAPNTGGGGGGAGAGRDSGGAGGSGIVVARYVINTRPTADAGTDENAVAFEQFTLDGTGSADPDNNITSYAWQQTGGTSVALSDTSAISPTFTPQQPANGDASEIFTFTLTVTDDFGLTHTDTVTITLQAVAVLEASKTVSVFSEDGSGCDDLDAVQPTEPEHPAAIPGACIQYTISVENTGSVAAENITLIDELPANLSLQATGLAPPSWGDLTTPSCLGADCEVRVEQGVIPANSTATLTIRATIN